MEYHDINGYIMVIKWLYEKRHHDDMCLFNVIIK